MKEQANPSGRMISYYGYATDRLKPLVTETDDVILLDRTVKGMKRTLDTYLDMMEAVLLEDNKTFEETVIEDLGVKIEECRIEQKKCLKLARKYSWQAFLYSSESLAQSARTMRECAAKYDPCIKDLEEVRNKNLARLKKNEIEDKTLVGKLDESNGNEKQDFENYLREFAIEVSAEDRQRYVENPDHIFFDVILKLREKYDPTGRI